MKLSLHLHTSTLYIATTDNLRRIIALCIITSHWQCLCVYLIVWSLVQCPPRQPLPYLPKRCAVPSDVIQCSGDGFWGIPFLNSIYTWSCCQRSSILLILLHCALFSNNSVMPTLKIITKRCSSWRSSIMRWFIFFRPLEKPSKETVESPQKVYNIPSLPHVRRASLPKKHRKKRTQTETKSQPHPITDSQVLYITNHRHQVFTWRIFQFSSFHSFSSSKSN